MENNQNEINIYHSTTNKLINSNNTKEEFNKKSEEHILSLRKKKNNKKFEQINKFNLNPHNLNHKIDMHNLIPLIQNEPLYVQYNSSTKESEKINYLLQMILSQNNNILKFSLYELKEYLNNLNNKEEFLSKDLLNTFNEKMFRFLFTLLFKDKHLYSNNEDYYQIISLLGFIISKFCFFNEFYINILIDYFFELLNLAENEEEKNIKNTIYIITNKILFEDSKKLRQIYEKFFNQVYNELIKLINESNNNKNILILKDLYPTLFGIINTIIFTNIQSNTDFSINFKNINTLLSLIKQYLELPFIEKEILKSSLHFLSIALNYYNHKKNNLEKESKNEFKQIINNIKLNKTIISYIYDNSKNDINFTCEIIEILNNMITLNDSEFLNNLIEDNICEQISNLQEYLLENYNSNNNNIIKILYKSHIDLIYNLISTQSDNIINNICIENSCISNLFEFINNSTFVYSEDNTKIIEIFDLLIGSKTEFVLSVLLSDDIYNLYKNILYNTKDNNLISMILKDISIMIEKGKNIKTSNGINFVSNHFIKNGIIDLINNIKSRTDINNQILFLLDEINKLLEE